MIKSELVQRIAEHNPHLYQRDVENIVNAILEEIVAALARGDRVELRGFGAFSVKSRPARTGRNPRTGESHFSSYGRVWEYYIVREIYNSCVGSFSSLFSGEEQYFVLQEAWLQLLRIGS